MDTPAINSSRPQAFWRNLRLCAVALCVAANAVAQVPEPETIIFGRVFNRTSGQEYQINEGTLDWTIEGEAGKSIALTTDLAPIAGGKYSYVLKVPHQALSYQLTVDETALPLAPGETIFRSGIITVNGVHADVRSITSDGSFAASQPQRANVHRIDLEVFDLLADTDGDDIPDWWEDKYGLNKQWGGDAGLRHPGNRFTYLQAFNLGLDPTLNDAAPQLMTTEVMVQGDGAAAPHGDFTGGACAAGLHSRSCSRWRDACSSQYPSRSQNARPLAQSWRYFHSRSGECGAVGVFAVRSDGECH